MTKIKIRVAYNDLSRKDSNTEILAYGFGEIAPYDPKVKLCDEMAGSMAYNIAKNNAGHNNIKIVGYGHEEMID